MDEPLEIEARGAAEGNNPLFGVWRQTFNLTPVPYDSAAQAKTAFKQAVRKLLKSKFVFIGQVALTATLYLNEQVMLETSEYGDLDNYSKQLLDTLKGNGGIVIDDCQIQCLNISWIDIHGSSWFEIEVKGGPDDFLPTPLKLYRMPDGLYYPISENVWTTTGIVPAPAEWVTDIQDVLRQVTKTNRSLRHTLRLNGLPQFRAFQASKHVSPVMMGFHKSRVISSGFELVEGN